uniref:Reverse transcriptase domain-containing protein n=1 Tax=Timema shepardi TaxID=629360 RepID=A0A7R9FY63_TIMSH|nr:unnamed protein product [Timema shepardi]
MHSYADTCGLKPGESLTTSIALRARAAKQRTNDAAQSTSNRHKYKGYAPQTPRCKLVVCTNAVHLRPVRRPCAELEYSWSTPSLVGVKAVSQLPCPCSRYHNSSHGEGGQRCSRLLIEQFIMRNDIDGYADQKPTTFCLTRRLRRGFNSSRGLARISAHPPQGDTRTASSYQGRSMAATVHCPSTQTGLPDRPLQLHEDVTKLGILSNQALFLEVELRNHDAPILARDVMLCRHSCLVYLCDPSPPPEQTVRVTMAPHRSPSPSGRDDTRQPARHGVTGTSSSSGGYNFKVVLLGEGCVGKTSVILRYVEDKFNDKHITTLQKLKVELYLSLGLFNLRRPIFMVMVMLHLDSSKGLLSSAKNDQISLFQYADDTAVLATSPDAAVIWAKLTMALRGIIAYLGSKSLAVNGTKTSVILFTRRRPGPLQPLRVAGEAVQWSQTVKYLGVTLDRRCNWDSNLRASAGRARGVMLGLAPLLRPASPLNHGHKVRLFQACIMSLLLYAAPAWAYLPRYRFSPLRAVYHLCLRLMLGLPPRTHTRVLLDLSGLRPLDVIIRGLAVNFFSRAQASPNAIVRGIGDYDPPALIHRRIRDGVVGPPAGYG